MNIIAEIKPPSIHPPRTPCHAVFVGQRHIRNALYEHIAEPVEVLEVSQRGIRTLVVRMTGRAQDFPITRFTGTWQVIEVGEE
jgi:hypothetical protein